MSDADNPSETGEIIDHGRDDNAPTVIRVDRREDIASICGRIDTAPTFSVVLWAPGGNRHLTTELGIRRLQRHAEESGRAVAIATGSVALSSRARQVGIPVARKPHQVRWDAGGRSVLRLGGHSMVVPSLGRYLQVAAILAFAVVAIALLLTLGPSVTVVAYPPSETMSQTVTIAASPDFEGIDLDSMQIPSGLVTTERTITLAVKATGTVQVPTAYAAARIAITNPTNKEVSLPAGAVLFGSPGFVPFLLDEAVVVPPGGTAASTVTAAEPGKAANLPAGSITGWLEEDHKVLRVTNAAAAAGGAEEVRQAISSEDVVRMQQMINALEDSLTLRKSIIADRPYDAVFLSTAETEIDAPVISAMTGEITDLMTVDVKVIISARAILAETLDSVARAVLATGDNEGEFIPGSVTAVTTGPAQFDDETGAITTDLIVSGEFARDVSSEQLRDAVKGKSPDGARSILAERYGIDDAEIELSPSWAPWLPRFGSRITVELRSRPPEPPEDTAEDGTTSTP